MQLNSFNVDGRLTTSVMYSITKNGKPMARWSYANNRNHHTNFFQCVAWDNTAKYANDYLYKGQKVAISGEMQHTIRPNGKEYYQIIANTLDPDRERNTATSGSSSTQLRKPLYNALHNSKYINQQVRDTMSHFPNNNSNNKR